ncbi:F-type H+-transporting ATPase subunit delta [Thermoactinomyces sp. DSM 45891]|uniref:F0F1 ATP synthase subunit delta n=1 Tax=Thermoactinomyces sp. DSM 45891 TaxID=1761907 RepID=UPI00091BD847|nr:F0F1 ATP synthase subunit delta [Thermoactinomyces sp. DSM 45891]SFX63296.1 F-type H+-transporting ATPase subunit delta [Thermoactinomyces sp. DSM 45891]
MSYVIIAKRYASALYQAANEKDLVDEVDRDLQLISEALMKTPEFVTLLQSPKIALEEKKELISSVFNQVQPITKNFLHVLVEARREEALAEISKEFTKLADDAKGVLEVIVTSASTLEDAERDGVTDAFTKILGRQVRIEEKVDRSLLGGLVVQVGDRLYDGSVKNKLERFQVTLKEARVG